MLRKALTLLAVLGIVLGAHIKTAHADDAMTLKVGTLAPAESPWGKVFKVWAKGVSERTTAPSTSSSSGTASRATRAPWSARCARGQLDGAAITADRARADLQGVLGAADAGALPRPGRSSTTRANTMRRELDAAFEKQGFTSSAGATSASAHLMTQGVRRPRPRRPEAQELLLPRGRPHRTDLLPGRRRREPEAAQRARRSSRRSTSGDDQRRQRAGARRRAAPVGVAPRPHQHHGRAGIGIGALVFTASKINSLPADLKKLVMDSGNAAGEGAHGQHPEPGQPGVREAKGAYGDVRAEPGRAGPVEGALQADARPPPRRDVRSEVFDEAVKLSGSRSRLSSRGAPATREPPVGAGDPSLRSG